MDVPSAAHLVLYPIDNNMAKALSSMVLAIANRGMIDAGAKEFTFLT